MSDDRDAEILEIVGRQRPQDVAVDFIVAEGGFVLFEANAAQPLAYVQSVHARLSEATRGSSAKRWLRCDRATEAQRLAHEQVEVLLACPVIGDRRAQAVLPVHRRVGYGGKSLLLQSQHYLGVERFQRGAIEAGGPVAEADNIDVRRRDQFEIRLGLDPRAQRVRVIDVLVDQPAELFGAVLLERHPDLERPESARRLQAPIVQKLGGCEAAWGDLEIFGRTANVLR